MSIADLPIGTPARRSSAPQPAVPGPSGLPGIGSLLDFRRDPTAFLTRLAREYGDIAHFQLGRRHAYQLNHPDLIRDVLVTHSKNFTKTRGLDRARRVIGEGLLTSEGEFHRRQRRLAQPAFHRDRIAAYGNIMASCAEDFSRRWKDGQQVDIASEMLRLTLTIVGHTLFGTEMASDAEQIARAMTVVFEYFNRLMMPFAGLLETLPLPSRRRFDEARALLNETVQRIINERRLSGADRGDLLSMLLLARDPEGDGSGMTDLQARDEAMTMFLAGHETTATWLTWTWHLLAKHPEAERKLHAELEHVLGGRAATPEDVPKLEFTRRVLAESLRLYPPVWTLTRRAIADYDVAGYRIPAGSIVGLSQFVMHRDPRFYPNPERFDPDRWNPEAVAARPKYSFFPFGGGPRLCIGEQFAWMEATLIVATLCREWSARHVEPEAIEFQPLITLRPKHGLPMSLARRSHALAPAGVSL